MLGFLNNDERSENQMGVRFACNTHYVYIPSSSMNRGLWSKYMHNKKYKRLLLLNLDKV